MQQLKWWQSAFIGAIGGLALAVLKLIDAKFFLSTTSSIEAYAGYLTYFCYMVLGSVAAVFLTDHELSLVKTKRSAFILGLLAPSVLLAIANQPQRTTNEAEKRQQVIPSLGWIPLSSANAGPPVFRPHIAPLAVQSLRASALKPTFSSALAAAVGRGELHEPYAYVVGTTPDKDKALSTAFKLKQALEQAGSINAQPRVVQIEGRDSYYVLMGDLGSKQDLAKLRLDTNSAALKSFGAKPSGELASQFDRKSIAELLGNAAVLPASKLAEGK